MIAIRTEDIKLLREETGASISEIRNALLAAGGDLAKARQVIERALGDRAKKKLDRETKSGVVDCYVHSDRKIGVLVEVACETDFVARNEEFRAFAHDIALHIAAVNPLYVRREEIPEDVAVAERRLVEEEVAALGKVKDIADQIITGKMESHFGGICLYSQPFVKNQDKTVGEVIAEASGKFGEHIKVNRFVRFSF